MALCRCYGNPDLFITMTANPKWSEIDEYLKLSGEGSANDMPDIESRVFHMKLDQLMVLVKKKSFFGQINGSIYIIVFIVNFVSYYSYLKFNCQYFIFNFAVVYTIEFQKRGLPHAYILVWLKAGRENVCSNDIDKFVSAELPDRINDHEGYKLVEQHMI